MRGEDTLWTDAHLTPVPICLPLSIMGRVESKYGPDIRSNSPFLTDKEVTRGLAGNRRPSSFLWRELAEKD